MPRLPISLAHVLCAVALMVPTASTGAAGSRPGARIQVEPPRLALLARHLEKLGVSATWDFASLTLDALLDAYRQELADAAREPASTPERRAKLARWRGATADLARQIQAARLRLLDGATFRVYADPQQQVLIIVDGRPIAVSGPRPDADRAIEERVIAQFCAYNDCSPLAAAEPVAQPATDEPPAAWILGERIPPTFEIYGVMRCEFTDIADRRRKAEACYRAAAEATELAAAIPRAQRQGYRIDWDWMVHTPSARASAGQVVVNSDGAYLAQPSRMLSRLSAGDWQDLVGWLRQRDPAGRRIVVLGEADRLLD